MKEKIFIIVSVNFVESEEDLFVTKAKSIDEAIDIFAREYYSTDDIFMDHLSNRYIEIPSWSQFFSSIYDPELEKIVTGLSDDEIYEIFREHVIAYLGKDGEQYTLDFIDYFINKTKDLEDLSDDFISYLALKEIQRNIDDYVIKEIENY